MLKLDLADLDRRGSLDFRAEVPPGHEMFGGSGFDLAEPVEVTLVASQSGTGQVWVQGSLSGVLNQQCTRCLQPVRVPFEQEVTLLFAPTDTLDEDDEDGEVRPLDPGARVIDLSEPLREELILSLPGYALCDPDCRGLCPRCGANLNDEQCTCAPEGPDPRWAALRAHNR